MPHASTTALSCLIGYRASLGQHEPEAVGGLKLDGGDGGWSECDDKNSGPKAAGARCAYCESALASTRLGTAMNAINWLLSKTIELVLSWAKRRKLRQDIEERMSRDSIQEGLVTTRNFDRDYESARYMLKYKLDGRFPDNYQSRHSGGSGHSYQHGEDRARAVDTMSAAIATALRNGATVQQAAAAGAASIGI